MPTDLLIRLLVPQAHAFTINLQGVLALCATSVPCTLWGGGVGGAAVFIAKFIVVLRFCFFAAAILMAFTAGRWMVMYATDENLVKEARTSLVYIIVGSGLVTLASLVVDTFAVRPGATGAIIVNPTPFTAGVALVIKFVFLVMGIGLIVNVVVQAYRILTSQGDESQIEKGRKRLIAGFLGLALILLSAPITDALNPDKNGAPILSDEILGILSFFLTIFGGGAVIAIVVAGLFLIFSVDESLQEKAKTMIKVSIIALVVVLLAYPLLRLFAS